MARYLEPATLAEASGLAREHDWDAKLVAGGTAVVLMMQQRLISPTVLIGLRGLADVDGWREVRADDEGLWVGGGVTLREVARSPIVRERYPSLARACAVVGNVRVRNAATLAGNVAEADYASDPPAVLTGLGAVVEVRSADGARSLPVADVITGFYTTALETGEIITGLRVPRPAPGAAAAYLKYCSRSSEDRPCVGVSASASFVDGAIASLDVVLGAVAPTPQAFPAICQAAVGRPLDAAAAAEVADRYAAAVDPIDDARGSAGYRRRMVAVFVRRALEALAGDAPGEAAA